MRSTRLTLAVTALSTVLALSACSDDGGDDTEAGSGDSGSSSLASESPTIYPLDGCQVDVKVTGALKVGWKGNAQMSPSGEATLYQSNDGKKSWIAATTAAGENPAQVVVTVKGTTYNAAKKGTVVEESEGGAEVTATLAPAKGDKAKVAATFTCEQE